MKKIMFILLFVPFIGFSQSTVSEKQKAEYEKEFDQLGLQKNEKIYRFEFLRNLVSATYSELLKDDNYKNPKIRKAILSVFNNSQEEFKVEREFESAEQIQNDKTDWDKAFKDAILAEKLKITSKYFEDKSNSH